MSVHMVPFSWERVTRAVDKVRDRLFRAVAALEKAQVPYAVVGGNAVAAWVARVDEAAVRNTRDVDVLIRRGDLPSATEALEEAGFVHLHVTELDLFLDGPEASARDAVHLVFANEKVRAHEPVANPDVDDSEEAESYRILSLPALVQIKLTAWRDKDRVHLRDLIDVGLVDSTWLIRLQPELRERLQSLLDNPNG